MDPYASLYVSSTSCGAISECVDPYASLCLSSTSCCGFSVGVGLNDEGVGLNGKGMGFNGEGVALNSEGVGVDSVGVAIDGVGLLLCEENSSIFSFFISASIQDVMIIRTAKGRDSIAAVTAPVITPAMAGLEFVSMVAITSVSV